MEPRKMEEIVLEEKLPRGRPRRRWVDRVKNLGEETNRFSGSGR